MFFSLWSFITLFQKKRTKISGEEGFFFFFFFCVPPKFVGVGLYIFKTLSSWKRYIFMFPPMEQKICFNKGFPRTPHGKKKKKKQRGKRCGPVLPLLFFFWCLPNFFRPPNSLLPLLANVPPIGEKPFLPAPFSPGIPKSPPPPKKGPKTVDSAAPTLSKK